MTIRTPYDPDVGRPKKKPGEHYRTPARSYKPPPELYARAKEKAAGINAAQPEGSKPFTVSSVLIHALEEFVDDKWEDWR